MTGGKDHPGYHHLQSIVSHQEVETGYLCEESFFVPVHDSLMNAGSRIPNRRLRLPLCAA